MKTIKLNIVCAGILCGINTVALGMGSHAGEEFAKIAFGPGSAFGRDGLKLLDKAINVSQETVQTYASLVTETTDTIASRTVFGEPGVEKLGEFAQAANTMATATQILAVSSVVGQTYTIGKDLVKGVASVKTHFLPSESDKKKAQAFDLVAEQQRRALIYLRAEEKFRKLVFDNADETRDAALGIPVASLEARQALIAVGGHEYVEKMSRTFIEHFPVRAAGQPRYNQAQQPEKKGWFSNWWWSK